VAVAAVCAAGETRHKSISIAILAFFIIVIVLVTQVCVPVIKMVVILILVTVVGDGSWRIGLRSSPCSSGLLLRLATSAAYRVIAGAVSTRTRRLNIDHFLDLRLLSQSQSCWDRVVARDHTNNCPIWIRL
jgi:hypothetical protein